MFCQIVFWSNETTGILFNKEIEIDKLHDGYKSQDDKLTIEACRRNQHVWENN